jgi:lysozyme
MKTSAKGVAFIAAWEGVVTRAYRDVGGTMTIGIGHTATAGPPVPSPGMTVTREEAFAILARDLAACEVRVAAVLPGAPQAVFDAAVSFEFNTGAIDRASWVPAYRSGDSAGVRRALGLWVKAGGRTVSGLVRRRAAEARLVLTGQYGPEVTGASPGTAARRTPEDIRALQSALSTLGFYAGGIDGIAGPETVAAVRAYQANHPDLTVDGIAGPATRASLDRDLAARRQVGGPASVGLIGTLLAAIPAVFGGGKGLVAVAAGLVVVTFAVAALVRHQADLSRIFPFFRG